MTRDRLRALVVWSVLTLTLAMLGWFSLPVESAPRSVWARTVGFTEHLSGRGLRVVPTSATSELVGAELVVGFYPRLAPHCPMRFHRRGHIGRLLDRVLGVRTVRYRETGTTTVVDEECWVEFVREPPR